MKDFQKIRILGVDVDAVEMSLATDFCIQRVKKGEKTLVITPNSEIIVNSIKDDKLYKIIQNADLVVPDGIGVVVASKILKKPLKERVTGIDLMLSLLEKSSKEDLSVFFLGAKQGTAEAAAKEMIKKLPNLKIAGVHHGYYKGLHSGFDNHDEEKEVIRLINEKKPDILFVAFGSPVQEYFMAEYKDEINAKLMMGVGGSFDVVSGNVKRAPKAWQNLGLEWLYRIIKEPKRLGRSIALPKFAIKVLIHGEKRK